MKYNNADMKIISPALERGILKGTLNNNFTPVSKIKLDDLENVAITNPKEGDILKYNETTAKWENKEDNAQSPAGMPDEDFVTDEGVADDTWSVGIYDGDGSITNLPDEDFVIDKGITDQTWEVDIYDGPDGEPSQP